MIEEEDDEDVLKKSKSLKSVIKTLFVVLLIILGAITIYIGVFPENQFLNFIIGFFLICFGTTIIQAPSRSKEPIRQTLTITKCPSCDITKVRNYIDGDFIFKKVENCNNCSDSMLVKQIYSVKLKKPTEQNKSHEKMKEPIISKRN